MIEEFHYRVGWRAHGGRAGHHAGSMAGGGIEFEGYVPLLARPDPRHLDAKATLADPFGQLMVRRFRQRAAIPVFMLADLSASMGFAGAAHKMQLLARITAALAYSAWRTGDPFGFFGCDETIQWSLSLPLRWHKGLGEELSQRLSSLRPKGRSASGLREAFAHLGRQRALVFVVSDFHCSEAELAALLDAGTQHDLVPVVLWDSAEYERLPRWGWAELSDPETGARRRLFMRPTFAAQIRQHYLDRKQWLTRLFWARGREPFFLVDRFDPDAMTRYFYQP